MRAARIIFRNITVIIGVGLSLMILVLGLTGIRPYVVLSGSMEPQIATGSICFVNTKVNYESIEAGEIVAYRKNAHRMVTHRVVEKTENGLITKGDANRNLDGLSVTKENYVGRTIFSVPYVGYLIRYVPVKLCLFVFFIYSCFVRK